MRTSKVTWWQAGILGLLMLTGSIVLAQGQPLPPAEPDTEAFLDANFHLQDSYSRVLCVSQDGSCPAEITATVPCLTASCAHEAATYSITAAFDTIQAASDAAQPGDLVIIMPGVYRGIEVEERGGEDGAYIHFLGWGAPGAVVINAPARPDVSWLRHHFYFIATRYYIIQNLAFEGAEGAGIFFSGYFSGTGQFAHHMIVMDVYSHDNGIWGLHTTSTSYMLIQDSIFTTSREEHGAYISGSGDNMVIRRNVFQGNNASGLQINADPQTATAEVFYWLQNATGNTCGWSEADVEFTGAAPWDALKACYDQQGLPDLGEFFEDGIGENLIVEQNIMTGNGSAGGGALNLASVRHSIMRNNLSYGNNAAGIACWDNAYAEDKGLPASDFGCVDVTIVNNTIIDQTGNRGALILNQDARDMVVYNNIIVRDRFDAYEVTGRSGQGLRSGANYYSALNVEESPGAILLDTDPASGSITGFTVNEALANFVAPGFAPWLLESGPWPTLNPDRPDYHLRPDSPLLTAGDASLSPTLDLSGTIRTGAGIGALGAGEAGEAVTESNENTAPPPPSMAGAGGTITYSLPEGHIYRLEAREGAMPEDISQMLDALSPGTTDEWLNISPDGSWLLLSTDRFDPNCAGWPCLVVTRSDMSIAEVVRLQDGTPAHSEGFGAVASTGDLITYPLVVYPADGGPHTLDLWAATRGSEGWSTPVLLTGESPFAWNQQPALAPDGSRVVFDCANQPYGAEGTAICEVNTDGTGFRMAIAPADGPQGTSTTAALHHPDCGPDGSIVFESDWNGGEQIWRLPPGAAEAALISDAFGNDNSPCVLPDGRIVSLWLERPENPTGFHEIKIMAADGSAYAMALTGIDVLDGGIGCGE